MLTTTLPGRPPIKIGGEWRPNGKGPHLDVEVRVAYAILHAQTLTQYLDGVTLTQLRVTPKRDHVLVMLKGTRKGKPLVAWFGQPTWREALTLVATCMDSGHVEWRIDEPPPWQTK